MVGVVFGRRGSGKTFILKKRFQPNLKRPLFIVEPGCEYSSGIVFHSVSALLNFIRKHPATWQRKTYIMRIETDESFEALLTLLKMTGGSLLVEEAWRYSTASQEHPLLSNALVYGRHWGNETGLDLILTSQRAARISRNATSQADFILTFEQREPRDLAGMEEREPGVSEKIKALGKYEWLVIGEAPDWLESEEK